jgi:hypothetical protein
MNETNVLENNCFDLLGDCINATKKAYNDAKDHISLLQITSDPCCFEDNIGSLIKRYEKVIEDIESFETAKQSIKLLHYKDATLKLNYIEKPLIGNWFWEDNTLFEAIKLEKPYTSRDLISDDRFQEKNQIKRFLKNTIGLHVKIKVNKNYRNWYHRQVLVTE